MQPKTAHAPAAAGMVDLSSLALAERLTAIGIALSAEKNLDRLLEMILLEAKSIANADGGTLYFRTADDLLEFSIIRNDTLGIAFGGTSGQKAPLPPLHLHDPVTKEPNYAIQAVYSVLLQQPINIADVYDADGFDFTGTKKFDAERGYRTHSVLTVPMVNHKKESIGCLQLINAKDAGGQVIAFSAEMQRIVQSLASQAAVILDNMQLVEAQKKLLESFIQMIAKAIDAKSPYTGAHCERVPLLTELIAEAACKASEGTFKDFDLNEEEKYELHIAGWLHDCGKVTTPVHVMDKSTKLETIFDRIELVRTRFEIIRRDAKIAMLEKIAGGADAAAARQEYEALLLELDGDLDFLTRANIGGEFMSDEHLARLKKITAREWYQGHESRTLLTQEELYNLSIRKGTLTNEERKIMNDHMVITVQMLEALPFPKHLRRVPEYACGHHERMDGKGYPKGIRAGTMSWPARMMAVADVFEALTAADRPYKPAKKLSESMKIIGFMKKENHLDPEVVDLFVSSKVYLDFARRYLTEDLIDEVDEAAILAIKPNPLPE